LSIAVDELFVILVGRSTVLDKLHVAKRESSWNLLLLDYIVDIEITTDNISVVVIYPI
jgi:hypothetical protein